ncbi:hypothetical protein [Burkholderia mayonis]|uniref:Uncharacterized protein n=1 Tax=Burkholderia mayonis TaxID=1385591 RepID=A0A1B4FSU1_9BURK|nr:hypothetical protein WS71_05015 [Burkholderia mayonis]KVE57725.1 hypothetical protein WS71_26795 [Burkholderia mayonis]
MTQVGGSRRRVRDAPPTVCRFGERTADFGYAFNLACGSRYTNADPLLRAVRELVDARTPSIHRFIDQPIRRLANSSDRSSPRTAKSAKYARSA